MNWIINAFHQIEQLPILNRLCEEFSPAFVCHITCAGVSLEQRPDTAVEELKYGKVGCGEYNLADCAPLDSKILEQMAEHEPIVLKLMDRLESYEPGIELYARRRELYLAHVRYWNHVIVARKIDFYLGGNIPHEVYDYVIYALCKIHGVRVMFFYQSQIGDLALPMSDWRVFTPEIPIVYNELQNSYADPDSELPAFSPLLQRAWDAQQVNTVPFYMQKAQPSFAMKMERMRQSYVQLQRRILNLRGYRNGVRRIRFEWEKKRRTRMLWQEYSSLSKPVDLSVKYVYLALHYQPELTTCPIGSYFCEQQLIVQLLDRHLPPGVQLVVKEHPKQEGVGRYESYYAKLLRNTRRTVLADISTPSFDLTENAWAVATVSGTVGWEALFKGKPVLLFGHNFYQYAPGVFRIHAEQDVPLAFESIAMGRNLPTARSLKLFMMAVEKSCVVAYADFVYHKVSSLTVSASNENLFCAIGNYIRSGAK